MTRQRYRMRGRRYGRRARRVAFGFMRQVNKYLPIASFSSTFFNVGDINAQSDFMMKFKNVANQITGKVSGINFFSDTTQYGVNISVSRINNPVTVGGITLAVIGMIAGKFKLPHAGQVKNIGMKIAIPSAIGAIIGGNPGLTTTGTQSQTIMQPQGSVV